MTILQTYTYHKQKTGDGVFVFHEFAPSALQSLDFTEDQVLVEDGERVRVDDRILELDEENRNILSRSLDQLRAKKNQDGLLAIELQAIEMEISYLETILEDGAVLAPHSSIVQFSFDGYEKLYSPYSLAYLAPSDINRNKTLEETKPGIKFVDNRIFYLAVDLSQTVSESDWDLGKTYSLIVNDNAELEGKLQYISSNQKNEEVLIFAIRDGYSLIEDLRFTKVNVVEDKQSGFILPSSSIYEEDGKYYCHIYNEANIVEKVEVNLLDVFLEDEEVVVAYEDDADPRTRELEIYDRLILDPSKTEEGDFY